MILFADILPSFIIKLYAPYVMNFIPYWLVMSILCSAFPILYPTFQDSNSRDCWIFTDHASFLLVGLGTKPGGDLRQYLLGIWELTFLSFTACYDKFTISGWSSGTDTLRYITYHVLKFILETFTVFNFHSCRSLQLTFIY